MAADLALHCTAQPKSRHTVHAQRAAGVCGQICKGKLGLGQQVLSAHMRCCVPYMTGDDDDAGGTETTNRGVSAGEPPVNSRQSAQMPRPRSRLWNHKGSSTGEADSLQNAINAFTVGSRAPLHGTCSHPFINTKCLDHITGWSFT